VFKAKLILFNAKNKQAYSVTVGCVEG